MLMQGAGWKSTSQMVPCHEVGRELLRTGWQEGKSPLLLVFSDLFHSLSLVGTQTRLPHHCCSRAQVQTLMEQGATVFPVTFDSRRWSLFGSLLSCGSVPFLVF